jgi:hypothetical protein
LTRPARHPGAAPADIGQVRGVLTTNEIQLSFVNSGGSQTYYELAHGALCPIVNAASTYTIQTTINWDTADSDSTRWAAVYFCCPDDTVTSGLSGGFVNGYDIIIRQSGQIALFKNTASTQAQVGSNQATQAISAGQKVVLSIQVTPTQIIVNATVNGTAYRPFTFTDSTYGGGYFHIGKAHSSTAPKLVVSFGNTTAA